MKRYKERRCKRKKLVNLLFKNYIVAFFIAFSLLIIAGFTVFTVAVIYYDILTGDEVTASVFFRDNYKEIKSNAVTSKNGFIYVFDKFGNLLHTKYNKTNFNYNAYNPDTLLTLAYKNNFELETAKNNFSLNYNDYIVKVGYNKKSNYILMVGFPQKTADFFTTKDRKITGVEFAIISISICSLLFFILFVIYSKITSRFFIKPLNVLIDGAETFAAGDYSARIVLKTTNEFQDLGDTLNLMASRISEEQYLKEKSELSRKKLILDVSHDLKNPLSNIMGYADYLVNNPEISQYEMNKYLDIIQRNSVRANNLIQNLFEFSKFESVDFHLDLQPGDICEFTRELIASYIPLFEERNFDYDFEIPEEKILILMDSKHLDRALSNLILNSLKYNPASTKFSIDIETDDNNLYLLISDNGIGIPKEKIDTIFDPFVRVDESRNSESGGTGLGLSITQSIISKHNGTIELISGSDEGCLFKITIPLYMSNVECKE